jgi:hypothetical protein
MKQKLLLLGRAPYVISILLVLILTQGCVVKLVADYNAKVAQEIINVSKQVDQFYGELLETNVSDRSYDKYKDKYIEIEVNIRGLIIQNKARPLNEESISISVTTLEKWLKYKNSHKENNIYKDTLAKNHRKRFTRLFTAMSVAEEAKKMKAEESENIGENK